MASQLAWMSEVSVAAKSAVGAGLKRIATSLVRVVIYLPVRR